MEKNSSVESESTSGINLQDNARTRVSSWLSGLVDEVRKKSQVPMQKWVDTAIQKDISSEPKVKVCIAKDSCQIPSISKATSEKDHETKAIDIPLTGRKVWMKESFLSKFSQSSDKSKTIEAVEEKGETGKGREEGIPSSNFSIFGRAKINEFYDRVRINKAKYNQIKTRKMETPIANLFTTDSDNEQQQQEEHSITNNSINLSSSLLENSEMNSNLKLSTLTGGGERDSFLSFSHKLNLEDKQRCSSRGSNLTMGNIGRSFSEANDEDEDEDLYLLNERSQSYSHVINRNIMSNSNNSNNNNNVSHSLPSFFDNKSSSSISPYLNLKMNPARDKSKSDNSRKSILLRDSSIQSDSSHCSSVESLLESRKPDPEAILINLGFGPVESEDILSRIPKRFLKPSQVRGIDTEAFLRRQQLANHLHDHSVLGYRGLVGNPDIPPSTIVAKIMERFEQNERKRCIMDINMNRPQSAPPTPGPNSLN